MANTGWNFFAPQAITTPEAAARQRAIADALVARSNTPAANWTEGLADIAAAFTGTQLNNRAMEAEEAGRMSAADALAALGPSASFEQISAALSNPWLSPAQSNIGSALLSQNMQRSDPMYQMELERAALELEALRNPAPSLFNPDAPTDYQNYQLGLADPAYAEFLASQPSGQTIYVGPQGQQFANAPFGQDYRRNPDGTVWVDPATGLPEIVQIPNGPQAIEAAAAEAAGDTGKTQVERYGNVVTEDIGRALDLIEKDPVFTTGVLGQMLSQIGGSPANRVANLIETVESNVGFDRLQAMRESSPTGGALGSVTERELSLLTSAIGSLKQSNNADDLAYNLRRVNKIYMDIIHGPGNWSSETPNSTSRRTSTGVEFSF